MPATSLRVTLLSVTPNAEALVYANAKQCTSADDAFNVYTQASVDKKNNGVPFIRQQDIIRRVMASGHLGIVEPIVFSFGVAGVSRALSHQLVRQRMASFCLSGDSVVVAFKGRTRGSCKKWTMKRLYEMAQKPRTKVQFDRIRLRSVNSDGVIVQNNIKSIIYSGEQDVYRITTKSGRSIKATSNHRFLTKNGYVELGNLSVGESVICNGLPAYKNPEWIKQHYIIENAVFSDEIISIDHVGVEDTYDIEMGDPWHNFVAEGFVVHNCQQSQRTVKVCAESFEYIIPESVRSAGVQAIQCYTQNMHNTACDYEFLIEQGVPPEDARFVLPNACETKIVVTMNARSLLHFFEQRCCMRSQWEIRALANEMLRLCKEAVPVLFETAGAACVRKGFCEEEKSCGRAPRLKDVMEAYKENAPCA